METKTNNVVREWYYVTKTEDVDGRITYHVEDGKQGDGISVRAKNDRDAIKKVFGMDRSSLYKVKFKKFNGEKYELVDTLFLYNAAKERAETEREDGNKYRITEDGNNWLVWVKYRRR